MKLYLPIRIGVPALAASLLLITSCGTSTETTANAQDPLSEALGLESEQDFFSEDNQIKAQEATASCMKEAGFEYVPENISESVEIFEDFDTKEWAEEWGFGVSTQRFSQDTVGPGLKGYDDSDFEEQLENSPNQKIREALSPEDQQAYDEALYGSGFDEEFVEGEDVEEEIDFSDLGCMNAGFTEDGAFGFFEEFQGQLEELGTRLEADSRIAEAEQALSDCVQEKGFEFTSEEDYFEESYNKLEELFPYEGPDFEEIEEGEIDPEELEGDLPDESSFEEYEEPPLTEEQKTKLGEFQTEEIATAVAAHDCGLYEGEYADTIREIENEYLSDFVETNKEEIEKYKQ